ncbi:MAG: GDYXXLXY domain-containing protein [Thiohalophilus sp.]|uniref:GDYXXLXY domain-containing protein n=1 Tax=Thiohalophilus sp. TaxID=3028392 RepID=UPI00287097EC|nr:GDYXXLXY domain-containing protein [Thiohalophilus sp.]MDR9436735.1 GDYXXLXY domain-containing protein [Thiohalophilus sp.]
MPLNVKVTLVTLVVALLVVNISIYDKEQHLAHGQVVYLELAPVDPRSLMQGDYMALRFQLQQKVYQALPKTVPDESRPWRQAITVADGLAVVKLDERKVATFEALYEDQPLAENELLLQYRVRHGRIKFATNAFYFQEGHAGLYQDARYGRFRVDEQGELLLVGLNDEALNVLTSLPD